MQRCRDSICISRKAFIPFIIIIILAVVFITVPAQVIASQSANSNTYQAKQLKTSNLSVSGVYTLKALRIDGFHAHLSLFPNFGHPTLKFTSATIQGLQLSHPINGGVTLTIGATGDVTATGVAIKTSLLRDLGTALGSFTNKADLLILITGGTVRHLVMKHVTLKIDTYLKVATLVIPGLTISVG